MDSHIPDAPLEYKSLQYGKWRPHEQLRLHVGIQIGFYGVRIGLSN
jgi:hypothetical protein